MEESALLSRSFLRAAKDWLQDSYGELEVDPFDEHTDITIQLPQASNTKEGGSGGAAFAGTATTLLSPYARNKGCC